MRILVKPDWPWWWPLWKRVKHWWRQKPAPRPTKIIICPPIIDPSIADETVDLAGDHTDGWMLLPGDGPVSQRIVAKK